MLGLDNMQSLGKGVHQGCVCSCEVCKPIVQNASLQSCCVHLSPFCGVATLCKSIVYPKGELDLFHKRIYLMGQCLDCGVDKFLFCPIETSIERLVQWCYIGYAVIGKNNVGQKKKVSKVEYKYTPPNKLIAYFKPRLGDFMCHNGKKRSSNTTFNTYLKTL